MRKQDLEPYFGGKKIIISMFPACQRRGRKKKERHIYVDNGAPILLVAHIDTVQSPRLDRVNRGAGFDDRLGVFAGHRLVQKYPELFDLLLTDYEERCATTAAYFTPSHDYNLVVELDREGDGFVDYGLASSSLRQALQSEGFKHKQGMFSDICMMDHVKCNKINLGLGTYNGHSSHSGFNMSIFHEQIAKLLNFAEQYKDTIWPQAIFDDFRFKWDWKDDNDICDLCFDSVPTSELLYHSKTDKFVCHSCYWGSQQNTNSDDYVECGSCGDPCSIEDLTWDEYCREYLCATCYGALHIDDEFVLESR